MGLDENEKIFLELRQSKTPPLQEQTAKAEYFIYMMEISLFA